MENEYVVQNQGGTLVVEDVKLKQNRVQHLSPFIISHRPLGLNSTGELQEVSWVDRDDWFGNDYDGLAAHFGETTPVFIHASIDKNISENQAVTDNSGNVVVQFLSPGYKLVMTVHRDARGHLLFSEQCIREINKA